MSSEIDNAVIKDSKNNEVPKSPGRLAAEERAERIRYAEEYRRKLEEEKGPVQPKKTKAAEQKEQAKLEKIAQEQAEARARLDAQRLEIENRISAAMEKIASLGESIGKTESEAQEIPVEVTYERPEPSEPKEFVPVKMAPPEPVKLDSNLVVNIPVQSFGVPYEVKYTQPEETLDDEEDENEEPETAQPQYAPQYAQYMPYPQPVFYPVYMPPVYIPVPINMQQSYQCCPQARSCCLQPGVEMQAPPVKRNPVLPVSSETIARRRPKPELKPQRKPQYVNTNAATESDPFYRPAISYGTVVTEGGWEHEIPDDDDVVI